MAEITRDQVVNFLSNMPVMEIASLVKELEGKWGVSAAPVAVPGNGAPPGTDDTKVEQTEFTVTLASVPADKKMACIKTVREVTGLGLKEAKDLVESAPKVLKVDVSKAEADDLKSRVEAAGGVVEVK